MGVLKDIYNTAKDAKDIAKEVRFDSNSMRKNSIAKMSSQATLQFPIIVSRSLDINTAQSVCKALERQYATFVQMVISLNPYLDLQKDKNMTGYLNKIHQNNPRIIDTLEESCMNVYSDEYLGLTMFFSINEGCNGAVLASNKKQLFCVEDALNKNTINDLYKPETMSYAVAESSMNYFCHKNNILLETPVTDAEIDAASDQLELSKLNLKDRRWKETRDYNMRQRERMQRLSDQIDAENRSYDMRQRERVQKLADEASKEIRQNERQEARDRRLRQEKIADQVASEKRAMDRLEIEQRNRMMVKLSDNDVKKSNELVPTTLSLSMTVKDGPNFGGVQNFIIGVKGLMHPVQGNEMVSNLLSGFKSGNKFFNFLRWTTGEITFLKDLLLNVDGIKEDVVKKHSGGSHWWTTLKRRKSASRIKSFVSGKNKILPNASIVCSMEEIIELKETYGLDLMQTKNIRKLMDEYFLLGFVIVDNSQELCYFIFDGETDLQAISFKGLEKENDSKNDFKEIYKMINSGRL